MIKVLDLFAGTQSVRLSLTNILKVDNWFIEDFKWVGERERERELWNTYQ